MGVLEKSAASPGMVEKATLPGLINGMNEHDV